MVGCAVGYVASLAKTQGTLRNLQEPSGALGATLKNLREDLETLRWDVQSGMWW